MRGVIADSDHGAYRRLDARLGNSVGQCTSSGYEP